MPKRSRSRRRTSFSICVVLASRRNQSLSTAWSPRPARASWPRPSASRRTAWEGSFFMVLEGRRRSGGSDAERPVRGFERRDGAALRGHRLLALEVALELELGRAVLLRPGDVGVADLGGL